jgi:hypothetical protein
MKGAGAVFAITILTVSPIFAQVHIRENATITPGQPKKVQESSVHTIRYEFYWSGGDSADVLYWNNNCNPSFTTIISMSSPITIEIEPAEAGSYIFEPLMKYTRSLENRDKWTPIYVGFKLYYDGVPIDSGSDGAYSDGTWYIATGYSASGYPYGRCCSSPWPIFQTPYSGFLLSLYNSNLLYTPVYYGGTVAMSLSPVFDCRDAWLPWYSSDPMDLTVVSGGQYASFHTIDPETGTDVKLSPTISTTGDLISNFYLVADSVQPDSIAEWVVVQGSSKGFTTTDSITICPPPVLVKVVPSKVALGDTAAIQLKQRNPDGTLVDFPPFWQFEVQIDSGSNYGTILSQGDTADYFASIPKGFKLIAADSIDADKEMVRIKVGPALGYSSSMLRGGNGSLSDSSILISKSKIPNIKNTPNRPLSSLKNKDSRKSIAFIQGEYGLGYAQIVEPQLVVIYPTDESKAPKDITKDPKMPDITAKAKLENYNGGTVNFQWNLRVQWEGPDGRQFDDSFPGNTTAKNSEVSPWPIGWNGKIRGGDEITLDVTAAAGGKVYDQTINHGFIIKGTRLDPSIVKSGLSLPQQVMVYLESSPKWQQFKADGFPSFGAPHGYGLVQLDNIPPSGRHASDDEVWNWKLNRATGVDVLQQKYNLAARYGRDIRTGTVLRDQPVPRSWYIDPKTGKTMKYQHATDLTTDEQLWKEAFHGYRGGVYWRWKPIVPGAPDSPGDWVAEPTQGHNRGNEAWTIYQSVLNGNPPQGWN